MRAAIAAFALAFAGGVAAQTVTLDKWQDLGPLLDRQSKKINEHTALVTAMQAKIVALEAEKAKIDVLTSDMGLVIQRYDTLLRAIINNVCASNKLIVDNNWAATLIGLRPIGIAGHVCPGDAETARYYVPQYLSPNGPPIPPPATP
jgi:hypothetical protein